jgi:ISXO2 transposase-like protein
VVIAAEVAGAEIGWIRMSPVPDVAARSLERCVRAAISDGSVVRTDGWRRYSCLMRPCYQHRPKNIAAKGDPAHEIMPCIQWVASLLKRWWLGTHQEAIGHSRLAYYLDEFTIRFTRRPSRARGMSFYRLL